MLEERIALAGAPGSPYTRKMLALLRYRRLPYRFLQGGVTGGRGEGGLPEPKVRLLPTFYLRDERGELQAVVDSTPIIRRLEGMALGRSVIPGDPALAFIDSLLEDYADEWLTKAMFHYRWAYDADAARAGEILPRWGNLTGGEEQLAQMSAFVRERQVGRLYVVGSNDTTAPTIEQSYRRFLQRFDAHIRNGPYVLGRRPAAADFAIFGQLTQLAAFDPTPMELTLTLAPQVYAWIAVVEDLSGLEPEDDDWHGRDALPGTLRDLLCEAGRVYAPALLANAAAVDSGAEEVHAQIDGRDWVQKPFPYQAKCLGWLRQERARLDPEDRAFVDGYLDGTGCEALF